MGGGWLRNEFRPELNTWSFDCLTDRIREPQGRLRSILLGLVLVIFASVYGPSSIFGWQRWGYLLVLQWSHRLRGQEDCQSWERGKEL